MYSKAARKEKLLSFLGNKLKRIEKPLGPVAAAGEFFYFHGQLVKIISDKIESVYLYAAVGMFDHHFTARIALQVKGDLASYRAFFDQEEA